ncbi:transcriptional repressor [Streptococcus sp. X16XC17]|uniref:Fur family transcriptional regulator n=1 Tax=unclassified Streptococcus TaxID=2608887 RepID=UPI00066FC77F|nr:MULTISPECIES: Fur family transcriptional regulator [unclassified Streptococcus]TCD45718.1 transcriptional repressor [Streptococcus sp. X16XC17]
MTHAFEPKTTAYEHVIDHLRTKGIRITETRKAVLAYLIDSKEHPSAEMIYRDLRPDFPSMSLATVYNNLKVLVDEGFVTEIKRNKDTTTYYDFMGHDHLNVICEKCGKITDIDVDFPSFNRIAQEQTGYRITKEVVTIYGICPDCIAIN